MAPALRWGIPLVLLGAAPSGEALRENVFAGQAHKQRESAGVLDATVTEYSDKDTITEFCDNEGLKSMHGADVLKDGGSTDGDGSVEGLEQKILDDVAREIETNNVDKMARSIFSFYVCARWAPDEVFWKLAEQELPAQFASGMLDQQNGDPSLKSTIMAIAEMYRTYKYVPMLCSRNLDVFGDKDDTDHTYFRSFKRRTMEVVNFLKVAQNSAMGKKLSEIDRIFCEDSSMVSCYRSQFVNNIIKVFGGLLGATFEEAQQKLAIKLQNFAKSTVGYAEWKGRFPYHSFIAKPEGWQADASTSPRPNERFVVCFGKRVASELHRRPNGRHILTDQNNVGCHGWYEAQDAARQIERMVELWKPPTCQMALMTYDMKREILRKFQEMNERLFDALPSILNDEEMSEDKSGNFDYESRLAQPYDAKSFTDTASGLKFVDDMQVVARRDIRSTCNKKGETVSCKKIPRGTFGSVKIADDGSLAVDWSGKHGIIAVKPDQVQIMPHGWRAKKGFMGHVRGIVAGVSHITDSAKELFERMFSSRQTNLANLMSGSVSKWAVCPIRGTANLTKLNDQLGVEDEAFKDFQKEGYKKWTGYEADVPGEKCTAPDSALGLGPAFAALETCDLNELHADHVEHYTHDDGKREEFICPIRPPLPATDQLEVLKKKGTCYLHMTGRQERHYSWHFMGFFPARRQNDRKVNVPSSEYELVKLIKVPNGDIETEISFGRYCSLDELQANPRFCDLPEVHNTWSKTSEMAEAIGSALSAVLDNKIPGEGNSALAPLNIPATAVGQAVAHVQEQLTDAQADTTTDAQADTTTGVPSTGDKVKQAAKDTAVYVGEQAWDAIRGTGRLVHSSVKYALKTAFDDFTGEGRMGQELQERLFGKDASGNVLHALSFQRDIGASGTTSNSKQRFMRYVMNHPCSDFDPALAFALRKRWSVVAVRMVKEAFSVYDHRDTTPLDGTTLRLHIRGDALRFITKREKKGNDIVNKPVVSMRWEGAKAETDNLQCKQLGNVTDAHCTPAKWCTVSGLKGGVWSLFGSNACEDRVPWWRAAEQAKWWPVKDQSLASEFAPLMTTGHFGYEKLKGLTMMLYCGRKSAFGASGPPAAQDATTLRKCLEDGVVANAQMKAQEPWKLYFPDEVVVVATFAAIEEGACQPSRAGSQDAEQLGELCSSGVAQRSGDFEHLLDKSGMPHGHEDDDGTKYLGVRAGKGYPQATLEEVVFKPQDILEALGLVQPSHGR